MTIYVAEIKGRPICAFSAEDDDLAEEFTDEEFFKEDLMVLQSEGVPLWDGEAEIYIRVAFDDERGVWESSRARAIHEGETTPDDEDWIVYLVPVSDPTDDDEVEL